jgi:hypothetical protein
VVLLDLDGGAVPPLSGVDHALIDEPIRADFTVGRAAGVTTIPH